MKNLSLRLTKYGYAYTTHPDGHIVYCYLAKPLSQIFHVMEQQCIIL